MTNFSFSAIQSQQTIASIVRLDYQIPWRLPLEVVTEDTKPFIAQIIGSQNGVTPEELSFTIGNELAKWICFSYQNQQFPMMISLTNTYPGEVNHVMDFIAETRKLNRDQILPFLI